MVTPKQLDFSSSGNDANEDSDDTLSRRKSPRKRTSSVAAEAEEETPTKNKSKKRLKKKLKKKKISGTSIINRIWNEEDELIVLKGLVDYRTTTGNQSKIDWDALYRFVGGSIVVKFSKEQVLGKIRKLKRRFLTHLERINRGDDPCFTRSSDSEAFGFSMMIWGQVEDEVGNDDDDDDGMDKEMLKEHDEPVNDDGTGEMMGNGTARKARQSENGEEMLKEHEEVADIEPLDENGAQQSENGVEMVKEQEEVTSVEPVNNGVARRTRNRAARKAHQSKNVEEMVKEHEEVTNVERVNNGVAKRTRNVTARKTQQSKNGKEMLLKEHEEIVANVNGTAGKETHDDDEEDELCAVQDAFETMMSQGLTDYQKKFQLEKLINLGTGKRRELSDEWKALCVEERRLHVKKLRFSAKLAEAATNS